MDPVTSARIIDIRLVPEEEALPHCRIWLVDEPLDSEEEV
jgi:hypothetical protein